MEFGQRSMHWSASEGASGDKNHGANVLLHPELRGQPLLCFDALLKFP